MKSKAPRTAVAIILTCVVSAAASAFTLEPMVTLLAPKGAGNVVTFRIKNDGADRLAVRFRVVTREISPEGQESNAPADDVFIVYPSRLVVEAGSTASVKVQWRGPEVVGFERSFRFVAEQVPVDALDSASGGSGLKILFRYLASLYVGDDHFLPELVATVTGASGPDGEKGYLVEIRNAGQRHVIAMAARLEWADGSASLGSEQLKGLANVNYLVGTARRCFIPNPDAEIGRIYEAKVVYEITY